MEKRKSITGNRIARLYRCVEDTTMQPGYSISGNGFSIGSRSAPGTNVAIDGTGFLAKWNKKVRKNDEVVIIGDLSWGNVEVHSTTCSF